VRVLVVTPELPYAPGGSGGSTRQFHLIRRLVERGFDVDVVAPVHASQDPSSLGAAGIALHGVSRPQSRFSETLRALRTRPRLALGPLREPLLAWQVDVFWTALRPIAERLVAERPPDVVLVEHDWAASWARDLPAPRALTLHNLSWRYYENRARAASGVRGAALAAEARRFARHDRRWLPRYDLLLAMSDEDRAAVAEVAPGVRCETVPNGVDAAGLELPPPSGDPVVLFTGRLSYPPNAEGLLWLLREVWPRVEAAAPAVRLLVVGPDPPEEARRLAGPRAELTGWVEEMAPQFERAHVVAVPILSGGGTRLKVVDGLASGRPVVATPMGAEGIAARDGEEIVLARDPEGFATALLRLLAEPAEAARIGAAGRRLAEERYDWRTIGDRLADLLEQLATDHRGLSPQYEGDCPRNIKGTVPPASGGGSAPPPSSEGAPS
jgi:glycosyltransferase involved in cell wall biosynthesis